MTAYLHFGFNDEPRLTVSVPCKETSLPRHGRSVSGYGAKLPTPYLVKWEGRWRRVYAACYGNAASHYIGKPGAWLAVFDIA